MSPGETETYSRWWAEFRAQIDADLPIEPPDQEADLVDDLMFDSLLLFESILVVEEISQRIFPEEAIESIRNVSDLYYWSFIDAEGGGAEPM